MKVYFYAPPTSRPELRESYITIAKTLRRADLWLSSNVERLKVNLAPEDIARAEAVGEPLVEQMDALVIEGSDSDQQAGYLVALAVSLKIPLLFLYQRGVVPQLFAHLTSKTLPKWVQAVAYTPQTLETHLSRFLSGLAGLPVREVPRIKFTLRVTRSIEQFLTFKTHNTKLTKADWLREQIEKFMKDDADWRKFSRQGDQESGPAE